MKQLGEHIFVSNDADVIRNTIIGLKIPSAVTEFDFLMRSDLVRGFKGCTIGVVDEKKFRLDAVLLLIRSVDKQKKVKAYIARDFVKNEIDLTAWISELINLDCGHKECSDKFFQDVWAQASRIYFDLYHKNIIDGYLSNDFEHGACVIRFEDNDSKLRQRIKTAVVKAHNELKITA